MFVATPPIEYIKYLVSRVASTQKSASPTCLMVQDVKKAFFYAPSTRPIFVALPPEALGKDDVDCCGMLKKSLYGTRDAALNWSLEYTRVLLKLGFVKRQLISVYVLPPRQEHLYGRPRRRLRVGRSS